MGKKQFLKKQSDAISFLLKMGYNIDKESEGQYGREEEDSDWL